MKLLFNERISPDILRILKKSQINHSREILNYDDLKDVHKYCVVNELSGQITGPLIESYIISKNFMCKNDASKCIGDATFKSIQCTFLKTSGVIFFNSQYTSNINSPT